MNDTTLNRAIEHLQRLTLALQNVAYYPQLNLYHVPIRFTVDATITAITHTLVWAETEEQAERIAIYRPSVNPQRAGIDPPSTYAERRTDEPIRQLISAPTVSSELLEQIFQLPETI